MRVQGLTLKFDGLGPDLAAFLSCLCGSEGTTPIAVEERSLLNWRCGSEGLPRFARISVNLLSGLCCSEGHVAAQSTELKRQPLYAHEG